MANYTMLLRHLVAAGYVPSLSAYPIFDETYRDTLNAKIIKHYQHQEIGLETADLFDSFLETRMSEIMPYYNRLYSAHVDLVNPLRNVDITETNTKQTTGTNVTSTAASDSNVVDTTNNQNNAVTMKRGKKNQTVADSDTPQGNLAILDLTSGGYASKVQLSEQISEDDIDSNIGSGTMKTEAAGLNSQSTAAEGATTETYVKTIMGNSGISKPELFIKFRDSLMNIDLMIISELSDLFMGVY